MKIIFLLLFSVLSFFSVDAQRGCHIHTYTYNTYGPRPYTSYYNYNPRPYYNTWHGYSSFFTPIIIINQPQPQPQYIWVAGYWLFDQYGNRVKWVEGFWQRQY